MLVFCGRRPAGPSPLLPARLSGSYQAEPVHSIVCTYRSIDKGVRQDSSNHDRRKGKGGCSGTSAGSGGISGPLTTVFPTKLGNQLRLKSTHVHTAYVTTLSPKISLISSNYDAFSAQEGTLSYVGYSSPTLDQCLVDAVTTCIKRGIALPHNHSMRLSYLVTSLNPPL